MRPAVEPIMTRRVVVRALTPNFYLNGHTAEVGETGAVDFADAEMLRVSGKAEILENAPARVAVPVKDLQTDPRRLVR